MQQYIIAGHTIQISGRRLGPVSGLDVFRSKKQSGKAWLVIEEVGEVGEMEEIGEVGEMGECHNLPVFTSENEDTRYELYINGNNYLFKMIQPDGTCMFADIRSKEECFRAVIHGVDNFNDYYVYFLYWLIFGIAALSRQTISIHSSAVIYNGKSVLFLGESGTGKSTHTQLWLKHIPDTELLNDDSPFIRIMAGNKIQVFGSPWSGKAPCYKNIDTPVAAMVRLSQAPYNRIRRLTCIEAIGALLPSCPFAFAYDARLAESIYSIISQILKQAPVYSLECLPDADAARLVFETLRENGEI